VTSITLEMSLQEAKHFLRDPQPAQEYVRGLLRAALPGDDEVPGTPLSQRPTPALGPFNCPVCGRPVKTEAGLKAHHTQKHSGKGRK
jgi:hypothetical protein